ncbi:arylsulfatase [Algibacter mikhailovii]|uniref:Arylsulfatase n=1 Tax=Algibacter mikhailovii TaxID=425498 RepID=A0A918VCC2_9FLAO|nr:arylsulfatase [Algibacter mikhailovii]GGZ87340.1 arylsulfatase [Algibacter mikhailovii]
MKTSYLVLLLFALSFASCKKPVKGAPKEVIEKKAKPNIIYILADDLGYGDVSFNGQSKFETPNIDKLAAEGMVFTQHYSGSTVCAPSRSALLTGMHTGHTAIRGNKEVLPEGQHPMPASTYTMAEMFKEAGYKTSVYGKWGLGYPGSEGDANMQGFDEFFGYNCQRVAHNYYPYHLWHNQEKVMLKGNEGKKTEVYAPDLIHDKAMAFIDENKDNPFFMFYASALPHAELLLPEKYMEPYLGKLLPEKKHIGIDDGPTYKNGGYGSQEYPHAAFAAMIHHLDAQVGDIVNKLEELGIADNTLIVFTSDNGPHREGGADPEYFNSNGIYKGYKRDLYEGGIHVPMIAKWPGTIKEGSSNNHISAFWDVMPTFAEIADKPIENNLDGISFLPTLKGEKAQKKHKYLYWEFHEKGGRIAIRKGKWKGVKYNVLKNLEKPIELYDLEVDPEEQDNIAGNHPELVQEITTLMQKARTPSDIFQFAAPTYLNVD